MTEQEANFIGAYAKSLLPRMTDEQVDAVISRVINLDDFEVAKKRLELYACYRPADSFDLCSCLAAMGIALGNGQAASTRAEFEAGQRAAIRIQHERERIEAWMSGIDDDELHRMRDAVLQTIDDPMRSRKQGKNPRVDTTLKALIANSYFR